MKNQIELAYLAGAMDSDGSFSIKKSTYHQRVRGDATQPVYSEKASIKQVTKVVPETMKRRWGGRLDLQKPSTKNGRPLWAWTGTDKVSAQVAEDLLPFLRIKRPQAELLLELRSTKNNSAFRQVSFWWAKEHPDWRAMPMMSFQDAMQALGYSSIHIVSQAVANGTLLALPFDRRNPGAPRIPVALVEAYGPTCVRRGRARPKELVAWREHLWKQCRALNKIGTGDHPVTERSGPFALAG